MVWCSGKSQGQLYLLPLPQTMELIQEPKNANNVQN